MKTNRAPAGNYQLTWDRGAAATDIYTSPRPLLLAEHAHDAATPGSCARCGYGVHTGQRVARLTSGEWAHTWCAAPAVPDKQRHTAATSAGGSELKFLS